MEYAAVQSNSNTLEYDLEEKRFFVVCIDIEGEPCEYVTVAYSHTDAIENVERELELTADPSWEIFGPALSY